MGNFTMWAFILIAMFLLYNYLIFELVGTILENPRLKKIYRIPLGLFNTAIAASVTLCYDITAFKAYIAIAIVLFIEFMVFHKDDVLRVLFVLLSCTIHIMAVRAICVGIFSLVTNLSIYKIINLDFWLAVSMSATFLLLNVAVILVLKLIPAKSIKIINQHKDQLFFMTVWLAIANIYFLFNTQIYNRDIAYKFIAYNQLAISAALLSGVYIVLFFTIKTGKLLNYKEKNDELLHAVENEQQFRDSVIGDALMVYEINLTTDTIIKGFENVPELLKEYNYKYSKVLGELCNSVVFSEDIDMFMKYASISNFLMEFENGKNESTIEYRRNISDGGYIWVRCIANIFEDKNTKDIKAFIYIKDINHEKTLQLDLKYKAERDSLTGLYNKGMTENLISQYLYSKTVMENGVLFIIDVDNFKTINDRFGHAFGDVVLCELSNKLRTIFKNRTGKINNTDYEDIIGRVGGDEFMVFIKGVSSEKLIISNAEKVQKAFFNTYKKSDNTEYTISSSIGISLFPKNGTNFADLYKQADIALYLSKRNGKNTYSFYNGDEFTEYESKRGEIESIKNDF